MFMLVSRPLRARQPNRHLQQAIQRLGRDLRRRDHRRRDDRPARFTTPRSSRSKATATASKTATSTPAPPPEPPKPGDRYPSTTSPRAAETPQNAPLSAPPPPKTAPHRPSNARAGGICLRSPTLAAAEAAAATPKAPPSTPKRVNFRPAPRGQISSGLDTSRLPGATHPPIQIRSALTNSLADLYRTHSRLFASGGAPHWPVT